MPDLFSPPNLRENLLPEDGEVLYFDNVISRRESERFFENLMEEVSWKNDEVIMFGKRIITSRKTAWYGDHPFSYTYSKVPREALPWTPHLFELKQIVEQVSAETYNSCLLNLYHSGEEGMGWHSDDEKELLKNGAIASVSLGADRKFVFKHRQNAQKVEVSLQNGSLLLMKGETQTHWVHRLPPSKKVAKPRINLTFRTIVSKV